MASHKICARFVNRGLEFPHNAPLDTPHVGEDRARFQHRNHPPHERPHLQKRRAQDDQFRSAHRLPQIARRQIDRTALFALSHR
jgi:hypothetical protein